MRNWRHARRPPACEDAAEALPGDAEMLGERFCRGETAAFDEALRRICPRLARRLGRAYGDLLRPEESRDLVVEALEQAFLDHTAYDPARPLEPWLWTLANHRAADFARSRAPRRKARTASQPDPADHAEVAADAPAPREVATSPERLAMLPAPIAPDPEGLAAVGDENWGEKRRELVDLALAAIAPEHREAALAWAWSLDGKLHARQLAAENGVTARAIRKRKARAFVLLEAELRRLGIGRFLRPGSASAVYSNRGAADAENGERRTENGERRTENGERRTENGERRTENHCSRGASDRVRLRRITGCRPSVLKQGYHRGTGVWRDGEVKAKCLGAPRR
ncbi:MAG: RNA polymerase sigma factor [Gammaproteobacteria bacterium]